MSRFILGKTLRALITLLIAVSLVFIFIRFSGDPAAALAPPDADQAVIDEYREKLGLDQPLIVQYGKYLAALAQGEFGFSVHTGRPVLHVVAERIPNTLILGGTALLIAIGIGVPIGGLAALNRNSPLDRAVMAFSVFAFAMPNFFFGLIVILTAALVFQTFVGAGEIGFLGLLMPAATLGLANMGSFARFTRSSLLETLGKPYMMAAEARGVPRRRRILRHALPNAAIPIVTLIGLSLGALIAGSVVTEQVFSWPGVGFLLVRSVATRDIAMVQFIVLLVAFTMTFANLAVDLLYMAIDPRIRAR